MTTSIKGSSVKSKSSILEKAKSQLSSRRPRQHDTPQDTPTSPGFSSPFSFQSKVLRDAMASTTGRESSGTRDRLTTTVSRPLPFQKTTKPSFIKDDSSGSSTESEELKNYLKSLETKKVSTTEDRENENTKKGIVFKVDSGSSLSLSDESSPEIHVPSITVTSSYLKAPTNEYLKPTGTSIDEDFDVYTTNPTSRRNLSAMVRSNSNLISERDEIELEEDDESIRIKIQLSQSGKRLSFVERPSISVHETSESVSGFQKLALSAVGDKDAESTSSGISEERYAQEESIPVETSVKPSIVLGDSRFGNLMTIDDLTENVSSGHQSKVASSLSSIVQPIQNQADQDYDYGSFSSLNELVPPEKTNSLPPLPVQPSIIIKDAAERLHEKTENPGQTHSSMPPPMPSQMPFVPPHPYPSFTMPTMDQGVPHLPVPSPFYSSYYPMSCPAPSPFWMTPFNPYPTLLPVSSPQKTTCQECQHRREKKKKSKNEKQDISNKLKKDEPIVKAPAQSTKSGVKVAANRPKQNDEYSYSFGSFDDIEIDKPDRIAGISEEIVDTEVSENLEVFESGVDHIAIAQQQAAAVKDYDYLSSIEASETKENPKKLTDESQVNTTSHTDSGSDTSSQSTSSSHPRVPPQATLSDYLHHMNEKDILNLTTLYPSMVVMDTFVHNHMKLLDDFKRMSMAFAEAARKSQRQYNYTTLEETKAYLASKKPPELTFEEALRLVQEEERMR